MERSLLKKLLVYKLVKKFFHCMGPAVSSPCSQQNIYLPIPCARLIQSMSFQVEDTVQYFPPISAQVFQVASCLWVWQRKPVYLSLVRHTCHMPISSGPLLFDHIVSYGEKYRSWNLCSFVCCLMSLRPIYLRKHPNHENLQILL